MSVRRGSGLLVVLALLAACGGSGTSPPQPQAAASTAGIVGSGPPPVSANEPCTTESVSHAVGRLFALLSAGDGSGAYALFAPDGDGLEIIGYKALGLDDAARHARSLDQFEHVARQIKGVNLELKPSIFPPGAAADRGLAGTGLTWMASGYRLGWGIHVIQVWGGTGKAGLRCDTGKLTRVGLNAL